MNALRALVIAIAVTGVVLNALALSGFGRTGYLGVRAPKPMDERPFQPVVAIVPGSPAALAGLFRGERLRVATAADVATWRRAEPGGTVRLVGADGRTYSLVLERRPLAIQTIVMLVLGLLMALFVILLATRAWRDPQARYLAIGFLFTAFIFGVDGTLEQIFAFALDALTGIGMASMVFFATGWKATPPAIVRPFRATAIALGSIHVAMSLGSDFPGLDGPVPTEIAIGAWILLAVLVIAGLAASTGRSRGLERKRIGWILATTTVPLVPWIAYETYFAFHPAARLWDWVAYSTLVLPFGFGYAMLRHRLIDVGFVIDRATVLGSTTLMLAGLFGGLQWAADQLLTRATESGGFVVQVGIAIVVLLVVRLLRARTEGFLERSLFAKRRRRIDAVQSIERDLDAVDDPAGLEPLVVTRLRRGADIEASLSFGGDSPADVQGAVSIPMRLRGRVRGALVCRLPARDPEFAPDERAALDQLATAIAIAREDLVANRLLAQPIHARGADVRATEPASAE